MMLDFLKSKLDLKQNSTLLKNAVTSVTWLQPRASAAFRGKMKKLQPVTPVTKKVTPVTNVTEKIEQNQRCNRVTGVTEKNNNIEMQKNDWLMMFEERAAIFEYEAGLKRREAEVKAFDECILRLLDLDKKHTLNTVVSYLFSCGLHNPD